MSGADHMASSPQNRARIQISILGHYLPLSGDISVLRTLWQHTGTVVYHQPSSLTLTGARQNHR